MILSLNFPRLFIKTESIFLFIDNIFLKLIKDDSSVVITSEKTFILLFSTYKWTDRKMMTISISLGIWYASMDEIHQLMVDGRHGSIFDVYLDSLGFITGVCGMLAILKIKEMLNDKNKKIVKRVKNG